MTAAKPALVVIGNGMAGMRTVEELQKLAPDMYDITVFGAEPHGNYNRILLSPVLAGEKSMDDIMLNTREWYVQHGITLHAGDPVEHIDRRKRVVRARSGLEVRYDRLLIATGSKPFIIPVPGHQCPACLAFRDIQDVESMLEAARNHRMRWSSAAACWARSGQWPAAPGHVGHRGPCDRRADEPAARQAGGAAAAEGAGR
jgi:nitrite reductase (NADH) large subunit